MPRSEASKARNREYMRKHRYDPEYREKQLEWNRAWHRKSRKLNRLILRAIKTERPCEYCGCHFPPEELHFHHTDPATKFKIVTRLASYSRKRMLEEIKKCILLCPACHVEHHHPKGES